MSPGAAGAIPASHQYVCQHLYDVKAEPPDMDQTGNMDGSR